MDVRIAPTERHSPVPRDMNLGSNGPVPHTKKSPELLLRGSFVCGRRDLNPHDLTATRTLILLVYQFQHFSEQKIIYQIWSFLSTIYFYFFQVMQALLKSPHKHCIFQMRGLTSSGFFITLSCPRMMITTHATASMITAIAVPSTPNPTL